MNMVRTSHRIGNFPEYIFSRLEREVRAVEEKTGRAVLDLGAGDPDVRTSDVYLEKLKEFVDEPDSHLYPGYHAQEFKEAVCKWYEKRFGVDLSHEEVLPLLGAKNGVSLMPLALADAGDDILVPDPGYPGFVGPALALGVRPIPYSLSDTNGFQLSISSLDAALTDKTRYAWLNFPSNPTGAVVDPAQLSDAVAWARNKNVPLVYDNAYSEITFDGYVAPSILEIPTAKEIAVEIGSFSKTFSFAGLRMGFAVGNREIIAALAKVRSQFDSGMSLPLERLGAYALLNQDMEWHENMIATYRSRRDIIAKKLRELGLTFELPRGSLYLWAKIPDSAKDSESWSMEMLRTRNVLITPGSAYGTNGERCVRASISTDISDIDEYL